MRLQLADICKTYHSAVWKTEIIQNYFYNKNLLCYITHVEFVFQFNKTTKAWLFLGKDKLKDKEYITVLW